MKNENKKLRTIWRNIISFLGGVIAVWILSLIAPLELLMDELIVTFLELSKSQLHTLYLAIIIAGAILSFTIGFFVAKWIVSLIWKKEHKQVQAESTQEIKSEPSPVEVAEEIEIEMPVEPEEKVEELPMKEEIPVVSVPNVVVTEKIEEEPKQEIVKEPIIPLNQSSEQVAQSKENLNNGNRTIMDIIRELDEEEKNK